MDDNTDLIFGIDLNQDPESLFDQLDSANEMVEADEERRRQEQNQISHFPGQTEATDQATLHGTNNTGMFKPDDGSHSMAKDPEINSVVRRPGKDRAGFYNCNICLEMAGNPILTCCGHLFCWPCFYQVPNISSTYKECPVCRGEVSESTIIPLYGNGGESKRVAKTESGFRIPPRPRAHRTESLRQQMVARYINNLAVDGAIRKIMDTLGATMGPQIQGGNGGDNKSGVVPGNEDFLSSRLLVLSGVDGMIEEVEAVINGQRLRDVGQASRDRRRRTTGPRESREARRGPGGSRRRRLN